MGYRGEAVGDDGTLGVLRGGHPSLPPRQDCGTGGGGGGAGSFWRGPKEFWDAVGSLLGLMGYWRTPGGPR